MPVPDSVRNYFSAGDTATLAAVSQAFEHLTGSSCLAGVPEASLFALLVEIRKIHRSHGVSGDDSRAKALLQDFISHTNGRRKASQ